MKYSETVQKIETIKVLHGADCETTGLVTECAIWDSGYGGQHLDMLNPEDIKVICTYIRLAFDSHRNEIPAQYLAMGLSL